MIQDADILYPAIALAVMTILLTIALGLRRFFAVRARQVHYKYYETFSTGADTESETLRRHSRNVQNLFEMPSLFYAVVIAIYVAGNVDGEVVITAWLFVALRLLHSLIHIAYNKVLHRFLVYGLSLMALLFLWIKLAMSLNT